MSCSIIDHVLAEGRAASKPFHHLSVFMPLAEGRSCEGDPRDKQHVPQSRNTVNFTGDGKNTGRPILYVKEVPYRQDGGKCLFLINGFDLHWKS